MWREDASNASDKYLRNRVRNKLVPLLHDLLGGGDSNSIALEQRLEHAAAQSREIRNDLQPRVAQFLAQHTVGLSDGAVHEHGDDCRNTRTLFLLPTNQHLDMVGREALHAWVVQQTNGRLFVGYHQLQRVVRQLHDSPHRRQWRLNLGKGWEMERHGDTLRIRHTGQDNAPHNGDDKPRVGTPLEWTLASDESNDDDERMMLTTDGSPVLFLRLTGTWATGGDDQTRFYQTVLGNNNSINSFRITPSWRPRSNPIKLSSFLRGQNMPLHLRPLAPIVTVARGDFSSPSNSNNDDDNQEEQSTRLVAVYVSTKKKWMVDAAFADVADLDGTASTSPGTDSDATAIRIALQLVRQPESIQERSGNV